ncbi:hypothetical protein PENSPDRAFT_752429 [Peniophora sp. CONT]|nr:hypothetical protein PENSPDRAFT_752429 [Peniophora sp. CONT]
MWFKWPQYRRYKASSECSLDSSASPAHHPSPTTSLLTNSRYQRCPTPESLPVLSTVSSPSAPSHTTPSNSKTPHPNPTVTAPNQPQKNRSTRPSSSPPTPPSPAKSLSASNRPNKRSRRARDRARSRKYAGRLGSVSWIREDIRLLISLLRMRLRSMGRSIRVISIVRRGRGRRRLGRLRLYRLCRAPARPLQPQRRRRPSPLPHQHHHSHLSTSSTTPSPDPNTRNREWTSTRRKWTGPQRVLPRSRSFRINTRTLRFRRSRSSLRHRSSTSWLPGRPRHK